MLVDASAYRYGRLETPEIRRGMDDDSALSLGRRGLTLELLRILLDFMRWAVGSSLIL